ncbi:MAG: cytidine deaminase [Clostridiales bacterium]|nr:cytidine deaminase [Clostridiales bacterium]
MRPDKENYYLDIAQTVAELGTCLRRNYGAIIVKNDSIVSTGYVGAPRGRKNCIDMGVCTRERLAIPRGERYEMCRSVHAEANAIIAAPRTEMIGATLYLVGVEVSTGELMTDAMSCMMCKRMIINAGITRVIVRRPERKYVTIDVQREWVDHDDSLTGEFGY